MAVRNIPRRPGIGAGGGFRSIVSAHRFILAILAAGVALRLYNVDWGLPHLYEEAIPLRFGMKLWPSLPSSVDHHFFVYPALGYYLQLCAQFVHFCIGFVTGAYADLQDFIASFESDPSASTIVGRLTTIAADAGIIAVCYRILDRLCSRGPALIAAALIAFNPLHLRQAHLINVDTLLAFCSVLLLLVLHRLVSEPSMRSYLLAGLVLGLAAASKYNGAILAFAVIGAHFLAGKRVVDGLRGPRLARLVLAGLASAGVFLALNPLIIPHAELFLEKFQGTETHMEAGHLGLDPGMSTVAYYFLESLPSNLGLPAFLIGLGTVAWITITRRREFYVLLLVPAAYVALLSTWEMRADRYILPAVPFLLMIASIGIDAGVKAGIRRFRGGAGSGPGGARSPREWITATAVLLSMVPPLLSVAGYQRNAGLKDTRTAAMEWIERNVAPGSTIATGPFGIELSATKYITLPIQFTAVHSERMTPFYNPGWYPDVDLVAVSDYDFGRYRLEPTRFATILAYLDRLKTSWRLIQSFEPGDSLSGPSIRLYAYPGEADDRPFPPELIAELLDSHLEPERKVAFLGKLGLILSFQGKLTKSRQLLSVVLDLDPGNATARKTYAEIAAFDSSHGAGSVRDSVVAPPPADAAVLVARGDSLFSTGDHQSAERAYRAALSVDRRQPDAYLGLTLIYASRDDRSLVVSTLRELLSILPPGSEDHRRVLWQLKNMGEDVP